MKGLLSMNEFEVRDILFKENIATKYASNDITRALVQMIPAIGPLIDSIMAKPGNAYKEERLKRFLLLTYKSLKEIEKSLTKKQIEDNIKLSSSEEFADILNLAMESAIKSRSREKLIINVIILTNLFLVNNKGQFRPEEYIYALERLSPIEVKILLLFYQSYTNTGQGKNENELQKASRVQVQSRIVEEMGIDKEDLLFMLKRIETSGFIKEITGTFINYMGGSFTITESLNRMMNYLSKHPFDTLIK